MSIRTKRPRHGLLDEGESGIFDVLSTTLETTSAYQVQKLEGIDVS
ncbi:hypothetical protein ACFOZ7_02240 [Natribaculum luteum]|uniref:Uncharacterized protein n=1 Tax=Natribaculum luteum TaxID=1586232 RepID=A0ABD5NUS1_9EURY|nr:hypothetical protein [Natribaculum luteum]